MNIERLKQVREFIAALPPKACDMTDWLSLAVDESRRGARYVTYSIMVERGFQCGTAGCIAGWTEIMVNRRTKIEAENDSGEFMRAGRWLELDPIEHELLFMGFPESTPEEGWKAWIWR